MIEDQEHFANIEKLNEAVLAAMARGEQTVKFEIPVMGWLAIFDEIRDRRPRNYSRLLVDDTITRLNDAIDFLLQETRHMIAWGPRPTLAETTRDGRDAA